MRSADPRAYRQNVVVPPDDDDAYNDLRQLFPPDFDLQAALSSLGLPHMPPPPYAEEEGDATGSTPTLLILVVADMDLASASALAEYCLNHKQALKAATIDLCLACGPFCRDPDLAPYLRFHSRRPNPRRQTRQSRRQDATRVPHYDESPSLSSTSHDASIAWSETPFFRSRQETAALEGLLTACLSQLESIVCRVAYCPGASDPLTTLTPPHYQQETTPSAASSSHASSSHGNSSDTSTHTHSSSSHSHHSADPRKSPSNNNKSDSYSTEPPPITTSLRLTPNSRNVHQQWLPIAPSLGCAGLFHLDAPERLLRHYQSAAAAAANDTSHSSFYNDADQVDSDDEREEEVARETLVEQLLQLQQSSLGYCSTLEQLLQLSTYSTGQVPSRQYPESLLQVPMRSSKAQSILVTHYVDSRSLMERYHKDGDDDDNHDGSDTDPHASMHDLYGNPYDAPSASANAAAAAAYDPDYSHSRLSVGSGTSGGSSTAAAGQKKPPPALHHMMEPINGSPPWTMDDAMQAVYKPYPTDHDAFLQSPLARKLLVCEIASGSAAKHAPQFVQRPAQAPLLLPGSLKAHGDFSLLTVSLVEHAGPQTLSAEPLNGSATGFDMGDVPVFTWKVTQVALHNIHNPTPRSS